MKNKDILLEICYNMHQSGDFMKKNVIRTILFLALIFGILGIPNISKDSTIKKEIKRPIIEKKKENFKEEIHQLKKQYQNDDIIAYIEIPNVLKEPIVQTNNNDYYLHYDIYQKENIIGATFLDYRNNIEESKKLLIYGHSDPEGTLPFVKLTNYNQEKFFQEHKEIYLISENSKRKYEVFSSYIEQRDFDYVNLDNFNGLTYQEHLEKLKNKSLVNSNIELTEESKVLILQTCSFNENISGNRKYQLVIAKEIEKA